MSKVIVEIDDELLDCFFGALVAYQHGDDKEALRCLSEALAITGLHRQKTRAKAGPRPRDDVLALDLMNVHAKKTGMHQAKPLARWVLNIPGFRNHNAAYESQVKRLADKWRELFGPGK